MCFQSECREQQRWGWRSCHATFRTSTTQVWLLCTIFGWHLTCCKKHHLIAAGLMPKFWRGKDNSDKVQQQDEADGRKLSWSFSSLGVNYVAFPPTCWFKNQECHSFTLHEGLKGWNIDDSPLFYVFHTCGFATLRCQALSVHENLKFEVRGAVSGGNIQFKDTSMTMELFPKSTTAQDRLD